MYFYSIFKGFDKTWGILKYMQNMFKYFHIAVFIAVFFYN